MQNVALTIGIGMTTQVGSDGRFLNAISAVHTSLLIDKDHCDIHISGSFFTELAKMIEWMFKSKIIGEIQDQVVSLVNSQLPATINKIILAKNGFIDPIPVTVF